VIFWVFYYHLLFLVIFYDIFSVFCCYFEVLFCVFVGDLWGNVMVFLLLFWVIWR